MLDRPFMFFMQTCWYPNQWVGILWDASVVFFEEREHYIFAGHGRFITEALAHTSPLYTNTNLSKLFLQTGADLAQ